MPTMIVATGYDLLKTIRPHHQDAADAALAPMVMTGHSWIVLAIGFAVSFVVALLVVAWFMRWVRARGFVPFAIYRIAVGAAVLVLVARGLL
jgi:undecaprenyl-diphosphatase